MNDDYQQANNNQRQAPLLEPHGYNNNQAPNANQRLQYNQQDELDYLQQPYGGGEVLDEQQLRQLQLKKKADSFIGECAVSVSLAIIGSLFVMINKDVSCSFPAAMWLSVIIGTYLIEFIITMYQYHYIKVTQHESLKLMALRYLVLVFLASWLIYGNVLYYPKENQQGCNNGLLLGMFIFILFGYFEMMKCFCIGLIICIMVPMYIYAVRRAQRPNWMPAPPRFIQNLYRTKFNPQSNQAQQECPICMVEFTSSDDIIPLPCDEKHYFHSECIKQWLEQNNNCPLCKTEITKEALKEQKKKMKNQKKKPVQEQPPPQ